MTAPCCSVWLITYALSENYNQKIKSHLVKVKWHTTKYGDPYSEFVLCIYPIQVHTHTQQWTHTHTPWTHTQQWTHTPREHTHTHHEHTHSSEHTHPVNTHTPLTHTQQWTHTPREHTHTPWTHTQQWTHTPWTHTPWTHTPHEHTPGTVFYTNLKIKHPIQS